MKLERTISWAVLAFVGGAIATTAWANELPTISSIPSQTIYEDSATDALPFTVGDAETSPFNLVVTANSSDAILVPPANIALAGVGANRTVTVTPAAGLSGSVTITLSVTDGPGVTSTAFVLNVVAVSRDWGDAPLNYHTRLVDNGARHRIEAGWSLGALVDAETNGLPSPDASLDDSSGVDDEDGITFTTALVRGAVASVQVKVNVPTDQQGFINAWIDFNADGDFSDAPLGEHFIVDQAVAGTGGEQTFSFNVPVPASAACGNTFARFRLSNISGIPYDGNGGTGEVEDYLVVIEALDFGDAPAPYPTLLANNGARQIVRSGWSIGASVDRECDGLPSPDADMDDVTGADDEDGVSFSAVCPGLPTSDVTVSVNVPADTKGYLNVWLDFNRNGDWNDPGDHIVVDASVTTGTYKFNFPIGATVGVGQSYARVRLNPLPGASFTGLGDGGGEIEDYKVPIGCDWGDAPDSYGTYYLPNNGPRHGIRTDSVAGTWMLGAAIDDEADGQPTDQDDVLGATPDDEDGVVFLSLSTLAGGSVQVTANPGGLLDAWIDFNQDGQFQDTATERIFTAQPVGPGAVVLPFAVPPGATLGGTWSRFRFSSVGGLTPWGPAPDGEVEDYGPAVVIVTNQGHPDGDGKNPVLYVARVPGAMVLTWDNARAVLEEAASVTGPFTTVPGAVSPHMAPTGPEPMKFYRLRVNSRP